MYKKKFFSKKEEIKEEEERRNIRRTSTKTSFKEKYVFENTSVFKRQCTRAAYCAIYSQWFEDTFQDTKKIYLKFDARQRL